MRRSGAAGERGSGSILVLTGCAVVVAVFLGSLAVVSAVIAAHRVRSAADLAALAAADVSVRQLLGTESGAHGDACELAGRIASVNGAVLTDCAIDSSGDALVTAQVLIMLRWPGAPSLATARSRAGPVS